MPGLEVVHTLASVLLLVLTATAAVRGPETLTGSARVIDGDSLEVAGEQIRVIGIDAPEGRQLWQRDGREWACGDEATAALSDLLAAKSAATS